MTATENPSPKGRTTANALAAKAKKRLEPIVGEGVDVRAALRDLGAAKELADEAERAVAAFYQETVQPEVKVGGSLSDGTFRRWNRLRLQAQEAESRVRHIEGLLRSHVGRTGAYPA